MNTLHISNTLQQTMYNRWVLLLIQKPNLMEPEKNVQNANRTIIKTKNRLDRRLNHQN